ncbi:cupin domain-containing protein [Chloroflexota bacterium]
MKVIKFSEVEVNDVSEHPIMIGQVNGQPLVDDNTAKELSLSMVTFSPGAKNIFHAHDREQILYIMDGKGIVATEDNEVVVTPGMLVYIPAGEKHWHGAESDMSFSHLSILGSPCKTDF